MVSTGGILFAAFERSGDEHAAAAIARLRQLRPELPVWALGGPCMAKAGAQIIEDSTRRATMLGGSLGQAWTHYQRLRRLRRWLAEHQIAAFVPVDSPAANWSICRLVRRTQPEAFIIHLVAPQLWAWASWRIGRLRRLTDRVLCILPFEPRWFESRGVSAVFVGHPAMRGAVAPAPSSRPMHLALLPGSRGGEVSANWPTMWEVWRRLRAAHADLQATVAAANATLAERIRADVQARVGQWPTELNLAINRTPDVLRDCSAALVVSGTATLQVAAAGKPMVALYNLNRLTWHLAGRWLVSARTFTLPNLLSEYGWGARCIREFVPHFGQVEPVCAAVEQVLTDSASRQSQQESFGRIAAMFAAKTYADEAAGEILNLICPNEAQPRLS